MDLKETLKNLEDQVSLIADPTLKKIAFEKLLDKYVNSLQKGKSSKSRINNEKIIPRKTKMSSKSSRPGPKAMLVEILKQGFFDKPRLVLDIPAYLKQKTGHAYSQGELSISLTRLLRDGQLTREKTDKGPYEWTKA